MHADAGYDKSKKPEASRSNPLSRTSAGGTVAESSKSYHPPIIEYLFTVSYLYSTLL